MYKPYAVELVESLSVHPKCVRIAESSKFGLVARLNALEIPGCFFKNENRFVTETNEVIFPLQASISREESGIIYNLDLGVIVLNENLTYLSLSLPERMRHFIKKKKSFDDYVRNISSNLPLVNSIHKSGFPFSWVLYFQRVDSTAGKEEVLSYPLLVSPRADSLVRSWEEEYCFR